MEAERGWLASPKRSSGQWATVSAKSSRAEFPYFAEADDNGAGRLGGWTVVEESLACAERAGVDVEIDPARKGALQLAIERLFGADDGVALIVANHHRILGVCQAAMGDADLDDLAGLYAGLSTDRNSARETEGGDVVGAGHAVGQRHGRQDKALLDAG